MDIVTYLKKRGQKPPILSVCSLSLSALGALLCIVSFWFAAVVTAPLSLAITLAAAVTGIVGVRRKVRFSTVSAVVAIVCAVFALVVTAITIAAAVELQSAGFSFACA